MATWKNKICKGMDAVEQIVFIRQDTAPNGEIVTARAVYVVGADKQDIARENWSQEEIDAIGETLVSDLDENLKASIEALEIK